MNENPAKQVGVRLEATDEPGKVDAVVRVIDEKPVRHSLFLDNSGTSQTGYYRAGYGFQNANLFNRDHVFIAQVIGSPTAISDVRSLPRYRLRVMTFGSERLLLPVA